MTFLEREIEICLQMCYRLINNVEHENLSFMSIFSINILIQLTHFNLLQLIKINLCVNLMDLIDKILNNLHINKVS